MAQVQTVLSATDLSLKRYIVIKTGTACELSSMPNSFMLTFCLYIFSINKGRFSSLFFLPYLAKGYTFYFPLKNCFLLLERVR